MKLAGFVLLFASLLPVAARAEGGAASVPTGSVDAVAGALSGEAAAGAAPAAGAAAGEAAAGASGAAGAGAAAGAIPKPPPLPPGKVDAAALSQQIDQLRNNIGQIPTSVSAVRSNLTGVEDSIRRLYQLGENYPQAVADFKARYDIPTNARPQQEVRGVVRALLEKVGLTQSEATSVTNALEPATKKAAAFKPFTAQSIMTAVGISAGMNILSQMAKDGKMDLGQALAFLWNKAFWAGIVGSGIGYSLASVAITAVLPPGGGLIRAFLPSFGAMAGSILGGQLGARGTTMSMKKAFKSISVPDILAQAAGSTAGMWMGSTLLAGLAGGLGSVAGPMGAVLGGIVGGELGTWMLRTVKALFVAGKGGATAAAGSAPAGGEAPAGGHGLSSAIKPPDIHPEAPVESSDQIHQLDQAYKRQYSLFIRAERSGDTKTRDSTFKELQSLRRQYDSSLRTLGHPAAPVTR